MQVLYTVFPYFSHKLFFEVSSYINLVEELGPETLQMCVLTSLPTATLLAVFREQMEQLSSLIHVSFEHLRTAPVMKIKSKGICFGSHFL